MMQMEQRIDDLAKPARSINSILLTAATRWEARPLAHALALSPSGPERWHGTVAGKSITLAQTGIGAIASARVLERDYAVDKFDLAISAGLCGALQEGLRTGDIIADPNESEIEVVVLLRETALRLSLPFHFGRLLQTDVVLRPAVKRKLGTEHRAVACDMETAAVRRWGKARIPVLGIRAVLDEIDEEIPASAPSGDDAASLVRFALAHACELPLLVRTGWRTARAMRTLSQFVKSYLEAL